MQDEISTTSIAVIDPIFDNAERALSEAYSLVDVVNVRDQAEALRTLGARQRRGLDWQNRAAEIKIRAERKAGEILATMPRDSGGRPSKENSRHDGGSFMTFTDTITEVGIPETTARRWQEVAAIPEPLFEERIAEVKLEGELTTTGLLRSLKPLMSSETPEWYTPPAIIERAVKVLGKIDLDPCAEQGAKPTVPAKKHYREYDDGLAQPWRGTVYMNPPYGTVIEDWCRKLRTEYEAGNVTAALALVPARTDTQWWQVLGEFAVCFIVGRLKFSGHENSAPFPSAVIYLGDDVPAFIRAFKDAGAIYGRLDA